ncbi:hypothetical protein V7S43_016432 [Phytophthora oleae]|uniref:Uncharacterized protein n=1 Tax=Phytophthora oleae TaxID=2107226 RepID=A0ABD3EVR7_9STRA
MAEDPELTAVAMQLSDYAFKMVAEQHKLAVGVNASYDIEVGGVKTTLMNPTTGNSYEVMLCCQSAIASSCLLAYFRVGM